MTIEPRGHAMNSADEGSGTTANHAETQSTSLRNLVLTFDRH
jgi:hypothetical protein